MSDIWWQQKEIDPDIAWEFLVECQENYKNYTRRRVPSLLSVKNNHHRYDFVGDFLPTGAVIHESKTRSVADTLRCIARGVYGTHFVIERDGTMKAGGPLSEEVPFTIFAPMSLEHAVPHAGYLSDITWGIDIINNGLLRPRIRAENRPNGIYREDFKRANFSLPHLQSLGYNGNSPMEYFTRYEEWTTSSGDLPKQLIGDLFYEQSHVLQFVTLIALLRALNAITPLNRALIVPASVVTSQANPVFGNLDWEYIREATFDFGVVDRAKIGPLSQSDFIGTLSTNKTTNTEESQISELVNDLEWRADVNEDTLREFLRTKIDWLMGRTMTEYHGEIAINGFKRRVEKYFRERNLSVEPETLDDSVRLWFFAQPRRPESIADAMKILHADSE